MNRRWKFPAGALVAATALVGATASGDHPATHNMLVVGERTVYLSHLPMFREQGQSSHTPHRYQAILEVTFPKQESYAKDRQANPATTIYTLNPEDFVLPDLAAEHHSGQSFKAKEIFRGHLERDGSVSILQDVGVTVTRVIHFRQLNPKAKKPRELEYLLFGKGSELFLAHRIVGPPDFDQVLSVKAVEPAFTDEELARGVTVVFPGTRNEADSRLGVKKVAGEATLAADPAVHKKIQVDVGKELYFEEGELRKTASFASTSEETKAGFP